MLSSQARCEIRPPAFEVGSFASLLDPQEWTALELMSRVVMFPRGSVLMHECERGERVMVLLEGRVKVARAGGDGQERLLSIAGPGDILGELSPIDDGPPLASVITLEPVRTLMIDARAFGRYVNTTPPVALALLKVLSQRFRDAVLKRTEHTGSDTLGRVAARLVELADRYGEPCPQGLLIALPLSQEELAGWVGACHAGLAKALQVLRALGWIETQRRRIVVRDLHALRRRAA
jgi:CRP-like cAMP-binding protein